jgi:Phage tail sheath protein subtilisin-like domain/TIR domain
VSGIVISYRREDSEGSAGRLYDRLVRRYDLKLIFMDFYSIEAAADWKKTIRETVSNSDVLVAVIGPRWLSVTDEAGRRRLDDDGDYVRAEIQLALEREIPVLPVLVQGASMMDSSDLPSELAGLTDAQAVRLDTKYFDRDIQDLYQFIDTVVEFRGELPTLDASQTAVGGFIGLTSEGPPDEPLLVSNWQQFIHLFGGFQPGCLLPHSVYGWFANGGGPCYVVRVSPPHDERPTVVDFVDTDGGLAALESVEEVTIVAAPDVAGLADDRGHPLLQHAELALIDHCERMGNRLAILDPPPGLNPYEIVEWRRNVAEFDTMHAALYYPWVKVFDPDTDRMIWIPPSGHVAGSWAGSDREKGVWAAPANRPLAGVLDVAGRLPNREWDLLRDKGEGINVIRALPTAGIRAWGARTLSSSRPQFADISTVRLTLSLISLIRGATSWAAFERSTPRVWERLQRGVEAVLQNAWRQGAMVGETASEAFVVRCDEDVNPLELAAEGRIRVEFGFAPKVPGEFVRMRVEQPSGHHAIYLD